MTTRLHYQSSCKNVSRVEQLLMVVQRIRLCQIASHFLFLHHRISQYTRTPFASLSLIPHYVPQPIGQRCASEPMAADGSLSCAVPAPAGEYKRPLNNKRNIVLEVVVTVSVTVCLRLRRTNSAVTVGTEQLHVAGPVDWRSAGRRQIQACLTRFSGRCLPTSRNIPVQTRSVMGYW